MKRIKLIIHQPSINKLLGQELNLLLSDDANIIDAISEVDKMIKSKGSFPVQNYGSFLHMVYNPVKNRFYRQVAVTTYTQLGQMVNVRDDPRNELPDGVTIVLIPGGGCITDWEEAIRYDEFLEATQGV